MFPVRAAALSLLLASTSLPAVAETYANPDNNWWRAFTETLDGKVSDIEAAARRDPRYQATDEFTRDSVLADIVGEMQAQRQEIDPATAVVTLPMRARLGDYDSAAEGFPVSVFAPGTYLPIGGGRQLHFRNGSELAIYPAVLEEAKALRARLGLDEVIAHLTLTDIRASTTRRDAYDAHVTQVAYATRDGATLLTVEAEPEVARSEVDSASGDAAIRDAVVRVAGIPPLGSTWEQAMTQFMGDDYFYVVADAKWYPPSGPAPVYVRRDGAILTLKEPNPENPFRVYLQTIEGDWGKDQGVSLSVAGALGQGGLDTDGLGAGLACGTPDALDRCAVLRFEPADGGHVLTAAWGVIELQESANPEDALARFGGSSAFDIAPTLLAYDTRDIAAGDRTVHRGTSLGVTATLASAGEALAEPPAYDPLEMTSSGRTTIRRAVELYAIQGAEGRTPLLYVLSQ